MKILSNKPVTSLLACLFLLGGCGDGQQFLSLGTAGTGGIYYPLGGALANRMSLVDPIRQYTAEVSGGSVENINRLLMVRWTLGWFWQ